MTFTTRFVVVGRHIREFDLNARFRRSRGRIDRHRDLPGSHSDWSFLDGPRAGWWFERDLIGTYAEITLQRALCRLQGALNQLFEFNFVQVGAGFSAHEVQIFAVAFPAIAKPQRGPALKDNVAKNTCVRQGGKKMKMNCFLEEVLFHLAGNPVPDHEVTNRILKAGDLAVHGASLPKAHRRELPCRSGQCFCRRGANRAPPVRRWPQARRRRADIRRSRVRCRDRYG